MNTVSSQPDVPKKKVISDALLQRVGAEDDPVLRQKRHELYSKVDETLYKPLVEPVVTPAMQTAQEFIAMHNQAEERVEAIDQVAHEGIDAFLEHVDEGVAVHFNYQYLNGRVYPDGQTILSTYHPGEEGKTIRDRLAFTNTRYDQFFEYLSDCQEVAEAVVQPHQTLLFFEHSSGKRLILAIPACHDPRVSDRQIFLNTFRKEQSKQQEAVQEGKKVYHNTMKDIADYRGLHGDRGALMYKLKESLLLLRATGKRVPRTLVKQAYGAYSDMMEEVFSVVRKVEMQGTINTAWKWMHSELTRICAGVPEFSKMLLSLVQVLLFKANRSHDKAIKEHYFPSEEARAWADSMATREPKKVVRQELPDAKTHFKPATEARLRKLPDGNAVVEKVLHQDIQEQLQVPSVVFIKRATEKELQSDMIGLTQKQLYQRRKEIDTLAAQRKQAREAAVNAQIKSTKHSTSTPKFQETSKATTPPPLWMGGQQEDLFGGVKDMVRSVKTGFQWGKKMLASAKDWVSTRLKRGSDE